MWGGANVLYFCPEAIFLDLNIKNKLHCIKKSLFPHFFTIFFAIFSIALVIQFLTSEFFIFTKIRQLLCTTLITTCIFSILLKNKKVLLYNYLAALLPLLSLLFLKITADKTLTSSDSALYITFCLAVTNTGFLLYYYTSYTRYAKIFFLPAFIFQFLCFIFSLLVWGYYAASGQFPNAAALLAFLQTNPSEALEYLQTNFTTITFVLFIGLILTYLSWMTCFIKRLTALKITLLPLLLLVLISTGNLWTLYRSTDNFLVNIFRETHTALHNYDSFAQQKAARQKALASLAELNSASASGAYFLVIGESQNKDHMSAYGYERPTTPWLDSMTDQKNFFLFQNAYACHSHTVPVLTYALTAKNQYNALALENAASIIEVAQAAGFQTVWISNQVKYSAWDTPVSVIADQAQTQYWLNGHLGETTQTTRYDLSLVDVLKTLPLADKTLVVLHLMGNHGSYQERYPHKFQRWSNTGKGRNIDTYDNSILYNDYVMQNLFQFIEQLPGFQGLVYFSDHADDVDANLSHDSSRFTFNMVHIPFYTYFSEAYAQNNPQVIDACRQNRSAYFTNDLIFDTMIDIMQIHLPALKTENSLANKNYQHTQADLKTLYGKKNLSEDPLIRKE